MELTLAYKRSQQFFFRRDLCKHRLSCQGIAHKAQRVPHYIPYHSTAAPYPPRSMRSVSNPVYGL